MARSLIFETLINKMDDYNKTEITKNLQDSRLTPEQLHNFAKAVLEKGPQTLYISNCPYARLFAEETNMFHIKQPDLPIMKEIIRYGDWLNKTTTPIEISPAFNKTYTDRPDFNPQHMHFNAFTHNLKEIFKKIYNNYEFLHYKDKTSKNQLGDIKNNYKVKLSLKARKQHDNEESIVTAGGFYAGSNEIIVNLLGIYSDGNKLIFSENQNFKKIVVKVGNGIEAIIHNQNLETQLNLEERTIIQLCDQGEHLKLVTIISEIINSSIETHYKKHYQKLNGMNFLEQTLY